MPSALLAFGPSLNPKGIKEGDDVYFECHVKSNPPSDNVTWRHNVSTVLQAGYMYGHLLMVKMMMRFLDRSSALYGRFLKDKTMGIYPICFVVKRRRGNRKSIDATFSVGFCRRLASHISPRTLSSPLPPASELPHWTTCAVSAPSELSAVPSESDRPESH